jgi:hypothetical protein
LPFSILLLKYKNERKDNVKNAAAVVQNPALSCENRGIIKTAFPGEGRMQDKPVDGLSKNQ